MSTKKRRRLTWRTLLAVSILLAIVAVLFLSVDFQLGRALLDGIIVAWVLWLLIRVLAALRRRLGRWVWYAIGLLAVVGLIAFVGYLFLGTVAYAPEIEGVAVPTQPPDEEPAEEEEEEPAPPPPPCPGPVVSAVSIRVDGSAFDTGALTVDGTATAFVPGSELEHCPSQDGTPYDVDLEPRTALTRTTGLALDEVSISARLMTRDAFDGEARIALDEPLAVEVVDLPRRSFFEARNAVGVQVSPYLRTESVTWQQRTTTLTQAVTFSYIQPGWRFARPLLLTFYRAGSVGEFGLSLAGVVGTFALSAILQPMIGDFALDRGLKGLRGLFKRRRRKG